MTRSGDDEHARVTSELAFAATIMPTVESVKPWTLGTLDHLRSASPSDGMVAGVELGPVLGEGGMGDRARSRRSARSGADVAVKTLREATRTARARRALQSCCARRWIAGALEHPNVVPVYDRRARRLVARRSSC
jgi:hypothetical protein